MSNSVLLVDRSEVGSGVREMFAGSEFSIDAESSSCEQAMMLLRQRPFQMVLMGLQMIDRDVFDCLIDMRRLEQQTPVIVFSSSPNPRLLNQAVTDGAAGFVLQSINRETFLENMRKAADGKPVWSKDRIRGSNGYISGSLINLQIEAPLTRRECQVIEGMAQGLTNKLIAQELNISYETVKEHVQRILKKIGVSDRTQAAIWAVRNNLI